MFLYRQFTLERKLLGRISDNESILVGMVYHQSQIGVKGADGRASQLARILERIVVAGINGFQEIDEATKEVHIKFCEWDFRGSIFNQPLEHLAQSVCKVSPAVSHSFLFLC